MTALTARQTDHIQLPIFGRRSVSGLKVAAGSTEVDAPQLAVLTTALAAYPECPCKGLAPRVRPPCLVRVWSVQSIENGPILCHEAFAAAK